MFDYDEADVTLVEGVPYLQVTFPDWCKDQVTLLKIVVSNKAFICTQKIKLEAVEFKNLTKEIKIMTVPVIFMDPQTIWRLKLLYV